MDRILSARIDDAIYRKINDLSVRLHTSKKSIIEKAIRLLGQHFEQEQGIDVFDETCGIWKRDGAPSATVSQIRTEFGESMNRHRR